jgi:hypothetical protein
MSALSELGIIALREPHLPDRARVAAGSKARALEALKDALAKKEKISRKQA